MDDGTVMRAPRGAPKTSGVATIVGAAAAPFVHGLLVTLATVTAVATVGVVGVRSLESSAGNGTNDATNIGTAPPATAVTSPGATATTEPQGGDGEEQAIAIIRGIIERCWSLYRERVGEAPGGVAPEKLQYKAEAGVVDTDPMRRAMGKAETGGGSYNIVEAPAGFFTVTVIFIEYSPMNSVDWVVNLETGHNIRSDYRSNFLLSRLDYATRYCPAPRLSTSPHANSIDPFP
jgi:hypothetical protein